MKRGVQVMVSIGEAATLERRIAAVAAIRDNVVAGRLSLDPEAGDKILSMLRDQVDRVDAWLRGTRQLARRAPLGSNPVGQAMAFKFEHRAGAADGSSSLAGVLTPYRLVLEEAHAAVDQAMKLYRRTEEDQVDSFQQLADGSGRYLRLAGRVDRLDNTPGVASRPVSPDQ
ncbi:MULTISPECIES: hypothetical protein [Saccharothrix]|uniref:hypothetical protein n=1 Tax=Saccharothrix TaxID=2071 RepID=UPI0018E9A31C|nr:hypothetical protein [Saccharothrix sp. CB00851]